ncbi:hypothetical protein [Metabacillus arenae]|uniref:Uncharacterized protein n=1 Tax=Metabacillus arenae TaxID=2771434 RepID=A0A926NK23_9BACI|nr:hypothetical protein [Metabacillus arenae]MBD1381398.1 hypothetical protein [Metabacillus arenae]
MFKRISALVLALTLAVSPTLVHAAETNVEAPKKEEKVKVEDPSALKTEGTENEPEKPIEAAKTKDKAEKGEAPKVETKEEKPAVKEETKQQEAPPVVEKVEEKADDTKEEVSENKKTEDNNPSEPPKTDDTADNSEQTIEDKEANENENEEDLLFCDEQDFGGLIGGGSEFNEEKGYFELKMYANILNCKDEVDKNGYYGFPLPQGVNLIKGLIPEGVIQDGRMVYVKYKPVPFDEYIYEKFNLPIEGKAVERYIYMKGADMRDREIYLLKRTTLIL